MNIKDELLFEMLDNCNAVGGFCTKFPELTVFVKKKLTSEGNVLIALTFNTDWWNTGETYRTDFYPYSEKETLMSEFNAIMERLENEGS